MNQSGQRQYDPRVWPELRDAIAYASPLAATAPVQVESRLAEAEQALAAGSLHEAYGCYSDARIAWARYDWIAAVTCSASASAMSRPV